MKTIFKLTIPIFTIIVLISCSGNQSKPEITATTNSETLIPTNFYTAVFTLIPATASPPPTKTSIPIIATEPVPFILNPTFTDISVMGVNDTGKSEYSLGAGTRFRIMYELEGFRYTALRFSVTLPSRSYNELTPSQITSLTSQWSMLIYCYRTDGKYSNQPVLVLDDLKAETNVGASNLIVDVNRKDMQIKFGDCRAFSFQLVDKQGNSKQGNLVLNPNLGLHNSDEVREAVDGGVLIGYPYSLYENETAFFQQGEFITVQEPRGGFYSLYYMFNFVLASGVYGTIQQEALANELSIRLFPYQENGEYSDENFYPLMGEVNTHWGGFTLDLPIDYLRENVNGNNMYYLQIVDSKGKTIKDEFFIFVPYTQ